MCTDLSNLSWLTAISTSETTTISTSSVSCQQQQRRPSVPRRPIVTCTPLGSYPVLSNDLAALYGASISHQPQYVPNQPLQQQQLSGGEVAGKKKAKGNRKNSKNQSHSQHPRPSCSYSCLIAMAFKATGSKSMLVKEIYRFIETEFPFFKTAPQGWKNSVRHTLSMHQNFMKVPRADGSQTKKGFYWAINPQRQQALNYEIERALTSMGRNSVEYGDKQSQVEDCPITGITPLSHHKSVTSSTEPLMQPMSASFDKYPDLHPTGSFDDHTTSTTNSVTMTEIPSNSLYQIQEQPPQSLMYNAPELGQVQPLSVQQPLHELATHNNVVPSAKNPSTSSHYIQLNEQHNAPFVTQSLSTSSGSSHTQQSLSPLHSTTSFVPFVTQSSATSSGLSHAQQSLPQLQSTTNFQNTVPFITQSSSTSCGPSQAQKSLHPTHNTVPLVTQSTSGHYATSIPLNDQMTTSSGPSQEQPLSPIQSTTNFVPFVTHSTSGQCATPIPLNDQTTTSSSVSLPPLQSTTNIQNTVPLVTESTSAQYVTLPPIPLTEQTGGIVQKLSAIVNFVAQINQPLSSNTQGELRYISLDDEFISNLFKGILPEGAQSENQTDVLETTSSVPTPTNTLQTSSDAIEEDTLMSGSGTDITGPNSSSSNLANTELINTKAVPENRNDMQKKISANENGQKRKNVKWAMSTYSPFADELMGKSRKRHMPFREIGPKRRRVEDYECSITSVDSFEPCVIAHMPPAYQSLISSKEESDTNSINSLTNENTEFTFSSPLRLPSKRVRSKDVTVDNSPPSKKPALCDEDQYNNTSANPSPLEELEDIPSPSGYISDHGSPLSILSKENFDFDIEDVCDMLESKFEENTNVTLDGNQPAEAGSLDFSGLCEELFDSENTMDMFTESIDQLLEECNFKDFNDLLCTVEKVMNDEGMSSTSLPSIGDQTLSSDSDSTSQYIDQVLKNTDFRDFIDPTELLCPVDKLIQSTDENTIIDSTVVDTNSLEMLPVDSVAVTNGIHTEGADLEASNLKELSSEQQIDSGNPLLDFELSEELHNFLNDEQNPWYKNIPRVLPELTAADVLEIAPATKPFSKDSSSYPVNSDIDSDWLNLKVIPPEKMAGINELLEAASDVV